MSDLRYAWIEKSKFRSNSAFKGGAIYYSTTQILSLSSNRVLIGSTLFELNEAH
jgi:predicted outer membrane repeat protein